MSKDKGGAAFPNPGIAAPDGNTVKLVGQASGMSLRDYFAAGFAQAQATATSADSNFIKPEYVMPGTEKSVAQIIAETSYALADAMIAARNA